MATVPKVPMILVATMVPQAKAAKPVKVAVAASVVVVAVAAAAAAVKVAKLAVGLTVGHPLERVAAMQVVHLWSRLLRHRCRVISRLVTSRGISRGVITSRAVKHAMTGVATSRVVSVVRVENPGAIVRAAGAMAVVVGKVAGAVKGAVVDGASRIVATVHPTRAAHRRSPRLKAALRHRLSLQRHPSLGRCMEQFVASFLPAS